MTSDQHRGLADCGSRLRREIRVVDIALLAHHLRDWLALPSTSPLLEDLHSCSMTIDIGSFGVEGRR